MGNVDDLTMKHGEDRYFFTIQHGEFRHQNHGEKLWDLTNEQLRLSGSVRK